MLCFVLVFFFEGRREESRKERKEKEEEGKYHNYNSWMTEVSIALTDVTV